MARGHEHWSQRYRARRKDALRDCRKCHAPNRPHRKQCWNCGGKVGKQQFTSEYWHELRRRQDDAINIVHTRHVKNTLPARPMVRGAHGKTHERGAGSIHMHQRRVDHLA